MRKVPLFMALGLFFSSAPGLHAAPGWSWSTSLDTIVGLGDTRYLMEEPGLPFGVSSELIFPLNTLLVGITLRGDKTGGRVDGGREWGFEASLAVNLLSPFGKMEDYDWWMYPGVPKVAFSYTESDAKMLWLVFSAEWKIPMISGAWGNLAGALGYRLQYVSQKIYGYNGWHNDDNLDGVADGYYEDFATGLALTYWVWWNVPTAGLRVTLAPSPRVSVALEAGLAAAIVADEDDHVLRYKLSTAHGLGFGGYADLWARYTFGKAEARVRPFLSLTGSVLYMKANTLQTQSYYAGPYAGLTDSGIDHQISTRQFTAALTFGLTF
jgi:hypothetical protein